MELSQYAKEKIVKSEIVRKNITLSNDPEEMLKLSLLAIYYLTGDIAFYNTNIEKILNDTN